MQYTANMHPFTALQIPEFPIDAVYVPSNYLQLQSKELTLRYSALLLPLPCTNLQMARLVPKDKLPNSLFPPKSSHEECVETSMQCLRRLTSTCQSETHSLLYKRLQPSPVLCQAKSHHQTVQQTRYVQNSFAKANTDFRPQLEPIVFLETGLVCLFEFEDVQNSHPFLRACSWHTHMKLSSWYCQRGSAQENRNRKLVLQEIKDAAGMLFGPDQSSLFRACPTCPARRPSTS